MKKTIDASNVCIRKMSGRKCDKVNTLLCPVQKDLVTKEMVNLEYLGHDGYYNPENFCLGLAAKFLYGENKDLFTSLECYRHSCGHYSMAGDGNHRMCVLKHLNEKVAVVIRKDLDFPCLDCEA